MSGGGAAKHTTVKRKAKRNNTFFMVKYLIVNNKNRMSGNGQNNERTKFLIGECTPALPYKPTNINKNH